MSSNKFEENRKLMVIEAIGYAAILGWFLYEFLPVGLK